jgi:UDP-hydrolysing UDP-N-acetyl-D-glucosamine 2-epimerase
MRTDESPSVRRRICVVTGTRAEYGLLYWLMRAIAEGPDLQLQIIATAMHLEPAFGYTVDLIRADGFTIDAEVPMQLSTDSAADVARSTGIGLSGLADAFERLQPDLVVLLGDRFETLAAAAAAALMRIPIAHIHGGEITEGAVDDALRHAVTKLAHLHFVATEEFRRRLIQLGEAPERVFVVGAPGLDNLVRMELPDRDALARHVGIDADRPFFLITYHPATLSDVDPVSCLEELLGALERFSEVTLVFTRANADAGGRAINKRLEQFVREQVGHAVLVSSLGQAFYLAALKEAEVVIGNSSSGIIEAPAANVPTVNIGQRQKGRPRAASIIDCDERRDSIAAAIRRARDPATQAAMLRGNPPYGRPRNAAASMLAELRKADLKAILHKRFHDLAYGAWHHAVSPQLGGAIIHRDAAGSGRLIG